MELGIYAALERILSLFADRGGGLARAPWWPISRSTSRSASARPASSSSARISTTSTRSAPARWSLAAAAGPAGGRRAGSAPWPQALAPFVALARRAVAAPAIAALTGGRFYLARKPRAAWQALPAITCSICDHAFEPEDMAYCPAYAAPICSLCCSLDARCHDLCKPHARAQAQVAGALAGSCCRSRSGLRVSRSVAALSRGLHAADRRSSASCCC